MTVLSLSFLPQCDQHLILCMCTVVVHSTHMVVFVNLCSMHCLLHGYVTAPAHLQF